MVDEMDALEQELLGLGQQELEMEQIVQHLRKRCRDLGEAGHFEESDAAWAKLETIRQKLKQIQAVVMTVETRLYTMRLRKRH